MGGDDEIAVVEYEGEWYVHQVFGGNAWLAIVNGKRFQNYIEASSYAYSFCDQDTQYGVCVYKKYQPSQVALNRMEKKGWKKSTF